MSEAAPLAGKTFGHYQLQELVALSSMAVVYRAWDPALKCVVAIKLVREDTIPDKFAEKQLEEEAQIASSLDHPNICRIRLIERDSDRSGIVMDFVEGHVLTSVIPENVGLPFEVVVEYGIQIADAICHAHEKDVIHRDLKSGNVMVDRTGKIKLLDFGLSKIQRRSEVPSALKTPDTRGSSSAIVGTPPYWAPEVLKGYSSDMRSDIWSFGVLLYEMASGNMPFKGPTMFDLGSSILYDNPSPLPDHVKESLSKITYRCLHKEMEHRYQAAREVKAALEEIDPNNGRSVSRPGPVVMPPPIRSVAVLPLENLSGSPDQEYFADGLTESLIAALAKVSGLRIISRTSTVQYKHARKTLPQIALELGVDAIVEGSVRRDADRVRIAVKLIEARTDQHLWTGSYDQDLRDILSLQSQVAAAIAAEIRANLRSFNPLERPNASARLSKSPIDSSLAETQGPASEISKLASPINAKAYDLYLKGRYFWNNQITDEDFRKAVEYYKRAIAIDPQSAVTYAGLAHCLVLIGTGEYGLQAPSDVMPRAKEAAVQALDIDESIAEAHLALAMVKFRYEWDWEGAEREFKRAIEIDPGYSGAHCWYSIYLAVLERFDEAFNEAKIARQLSPLSPMMHFSLGLLLYASGQNEEAIEQLRETAALDAKFPLSYVVLGLTFGRRGRYDEAIAEFNHALKIAGTRHLWSGFLGQVDGLAGKTEDAIEILHELLAASKHGYVPPVAFAVVYAGLGKVDDAFHWLEKAADEKDGLLIYLKVGSAFDSLRADRRFAGVLTRVGLQQDTGLAVVHPNPPDPVQPPPPIPPPIPKPPKWLWLVILLIAVAMVIAYRSVVWPWPFTSPPRVILAIQPIKVLDGDAAARRLAEITTEEIFTRMSEVHPQRLGVVELTTSDSGLSLEKICTARNANYILTGAVHRQGAQLALTTQLLSCPDLTAVIGEHYEIDPDGSGMGPAVIEIVGKILAALPNDIEPTHQVNPKAYDAYLRGRFEWNLRTTSSLTQAVSYFEQAITYDKNYAPSYAGLADCYALLGSAPYTALRPSEAFPKAKENATKALGLDPNLAEAHVSLGYAALAYDWDYPKAEEEFREAIRLRPDYATAHQYYAYYLTAMGDVDQAIVERKRAVEIEPKSPLLNTALGEAFYQARQFSLSIGPNQQALAIDSHYADAIINIGRAYEQMGMYPQALMAYQSILNFAPNDPALLALVGHLYAVTGERKKAETIISKLQGLTGTRYVPSVYVALIYVGLRNNNAAFAWLNQAYNERCEYLIYLPTEPMADPIRNDPRFPELLARLGLKK